MITKHTKCQMDKTCKVTHMNGECKRRCYFNTIEIPTNADRIRAMSDEEIAKWIAEYTDCLCGIHKPGCSKTKGTCVSTWLDWLRQEVANNSTT